MLKEVGFENVQGRLLYPFGMASRFRGTKPEKLGQQTGSLD